MTGTELDAYLLLERLRWGEWPDTCPHCLAPTRCYFLGAVSGRRVWKCATCRRQFSVLIGTVLQGTRLSLWVWIGVAADWQRTGGLPSPTEIRDRYGVSLPAARQLRRRLTRAGSLLGDR